jgi:hypothetical protein
VRNLDKLVEDVLLGVRVTPRPDVAPLGDGTFELGYLALTADELVLVQGHDAVIGAVAKRVLATVPREDVHEVRLGEGKGEPQRPLDVVFRDGDCWRLQVAHGDAHRAEQLVASLART